MSKRKKKHHHEEHMDESWLIPYADLLTLLLALFIVLFASSSVDAVKFQMISQSFSEVFSGGTGVMEYNSPMPQGEVDTPIDKKKEEEEKVEKQNEEQKQTPANLEKDREELEDLQAKINSYIEKSNLTDKLDTSLTDEGLLLSIRDNVLFKSGSADISGQDLKTATEIAGLLILNPPRNIIISGHTDNVPIGSSRYESNWELSVMRAVNFMKIILDDDNLDPRWFSAKGFGEFQPIASNDTSEGKARNRRVEILILPRS